MTNILDLLWLPFAAATALITAALVEVPVIGPVIDRLTAR